MLEQSRSFVAALFGAAVFLATPAAAQPEIFPTSGINWTVEPAFGQSGEGRDNVSGATCMPPGRTCLVVNDTTRFAQLFSVAGTTIRPGPIAGIFPAPAPGTLAFEPNMEGAAHDDRFFYLVTSRGRAGSLGQDASFLVARFTPEPAPPAPPVPFSSGTAAGLEVSDRIRAALAAGIPIPQLPGQKLDRANAEIEGIAVKDRDRAHVLHLGFRAPVLGGNAFILSASVENVFASSGPLNATVTMLALGGPAFGIRDLATVSDGLLILAGPGRSVVGRPSLFHWNDTTGQLKLVGNIAEPADRNGEALLLLAEDPEFFRFLLMFDGAPNGGPLEYFVSR
jgi:uncharacterized protein DUF3616